MTTPVNRTVSPNDARQVVASLLRAGSTIADYNTYKLTKVNLLKVNRTTDPPQTPIQTPQIHTHTHTHAQQQTLMCNKSNKADDDAIGLRRRLGLGRSTVA